MNIEQRLTRLEKLLFVNDEPAPLVFIKVIDQRKNSRDRGDIRIAVVPGAACGHPGQTLTRDLNETEGAFLARCSKAYSELYE